MYEQTHVRKLLVLGLLAFLAEVILTNNNMRIQMANNSWTCLERIDQMDQILVSL